ncbi:MAG: hypothetical protein JSS50_01785 [Proteobacteria bacterium]|nr:hypothetical protein [Pseudomonadota bacterium]
MKPSDGTQVVDQTQTGLGGKNQGPPGSAGGAANHMSSSQSLHQEQTKEDTTSGAQGKEKRSIVNAETNKPMVHPSTSHSPELSINYSLKSLKSDSWKISRANSRLSVDFSGYNEEEIKLAISTIATCTAIIELNFHNIHFSKEVAEHFATQLSSKKNIISLSLHMTGLTGDDNCGENYYVADALISVLKGNVDLQSLEVATDKPDKVGMYIYSFSELMKVVCVQEKLHTAVFDMLIPADHHIPKRFISFKEARPTYAVPKEFLPLIRDNTSLEILHFKLNKEHTATGECELINQIVLQNKTLRSLYIGIPLHESQFTYLVKAMQYNDTLIEFIDLHPHRFIAYNYEKDDRLHKARQKLFELNKDGLIPRIYTRAILFDGRGEWIERNRKLLKFNLEKSFIEEATDTLGLRASDYLILKHQLQYIVRRLELSVADDNYQQPESTSSTFTNRLDIGKQELMLFVNSPNGQDKVWRYPGTEEMKRKAIAKAKANHMISWLGSAHILKQDLEWATTAGIAEYGITLSLVLPIEIVQIIQQYMHAIGVANHKYLRNAPDSHEAITLSKQGINIFRAKMALIEAYPKELYDVAMGLEPKNETTIAEVEQELLKVQKELKPDAELRLPTTCIYGPRIVPYRLALKLQLFDLRILRVRCEIKSRKEFYQSYWPDDKEIELASQGEASAIIWSDFDRETKDRNPEYESWISPEPDLPLVEEVHDIEEGITTTSNTTTTTSTTTAANNTASNNHPIHSGNDKYGPLNHKISVLLAGTCLGSLLDFVRNKYTYIGVVGGCLWISNTYLASPYSYILAAAATSVMEAFSWLGRCANNPQHNHMINGAVLIVNTGAACGIIALVEDNALHTALKAIQPEASYVASAITCLATVYGIVRLAGHLDNKLLEGAVIASCIASAAVLIGQWEADITVVSAVCMIGVSYALRTFADLVTGSSGTARSAV